MNYFKLPLVVLLSICVSGLLAIIPAAAQGSTALERGYQERLDAGHGCSLAGVYRSGSKSESEESKGAVHS